MPTTNQKIGHLIAQVRQDKGLTQAEFARRLNTSQSAVNRMEHGRQNLSLETLGRVSDVLTQQLISINQGAVALFIAGGHELSGEIAVKTSKNARVALLCASLLNRGVTKLKNVALIEVLTSIGVSVRWVGTNDLEIRPPETLKLEAINKEAARKTRSVLMFIGPLMHKSKKFSIPYAGGCELGRRTVLPHLYGLEEFGVGVSTKSGYYHVMSKPRLPTRSVVLYESGDTTT